MRRGPQWPTPEGPSADLLLIKLDRLICKLRVLSFSSVRHVKHDAAAEAALITITHVVGGEVNFLHSLTQSGNIGRSPFPIRPTQTQGATSCGLWPVVTRSLG